MIVLILIKTSSHVDPSHEHLGAVSGTSRFDLVKGAEGAAESRSPTEYSSGTDYTTIITGPGLTSSLRSG